MSVSLSPDGVVSRGRGTCALWWHDTPQGAAGAVGYIGHWRGDGEQDGAMVREACAVLRARGVRQIVAPIDGSTWARYRVVTESCDEAPFLLEHVYPQHVAAPFVSEGFKAIATYRSVSVPLSQGVFARPLGVRIRAIRMDRFDEELLYLHRIALASFREALLYSPLPADAFTAAYATLRPLIEFPLVQVAEVDAAPVGFVFAIRPPDDPCSVIVKTMAILPAWRRRGIGAALMGSVQRAAHGLGATRAIHALAHEGNPSTRFAGDRARPMRRYALLARTQP